MNILPQNEMDSHPIFKRLDPFRKLTLEAKGCLSSGSVTLQLERLILGILEGQSYYDLKQESHPVLPITFSV